MARTVETWVGATDDTPIPTRVRIRVFDRYGGVCQLTGRKIRAGEKWQADHRIAIVNGGRNSEDNLWPVLEAPHRVKTAEDVALKAKIARTRAKHLGIHPKSGLSKHPTLVRGFDGKVRERVS